MRIFTHKLQQVIDVKCCEVDWLCWSAGWSAAGCSVAGDIPLKQLQRILETIVQAHYRGTWDLRMQLPLKYYHLNFLEMVANELR
jgi:hypothetical protein